MTHSTNFIFCSNKIKYNKIFFLIYKTKRDIQHVKIDLNPLSNKIYNVNDDRDIKCHFSIVRKAIKIISHAKSYVYICCYFLLTLYKNNERC